MDIYITLETVAYPAEILERMGALKPDGRLSDPVKIAASRQAKVETAASSYHTASIRAIGIHIPDRSMTMYLDVEQLDNPGEREILTKLKSIFDHELKGDWRLVVESQNTIRWIMTRGSKYSLGLHPYIWAAVTGPHMDDIEAMWALAGRMGSGECLDKLVTFYGLPTLPEGSTLEQKINWKLMSLESIHDKLTRL